MRPPKRFRLYAFDMDGTLVEPYLSNGQRIEGVEYEQPKLRPGVAAMIRVLARASGEFALVTNQGGVAFGYATEEQARARVAATVAALGWFAGQPFSVHISYAHPEASIEKYRADPDNRRKPGPGMILEAMDSHGASRDETVMVGDMNADKWMAEAAKVAYYHVDEFMPLLNVGPRALKSGSS